METIQDIENQLRQASEITDKLVDLFKEFTKLPIEVQILMINSEKFDAIFECLNESKKLLEN